MFGSSYHRPNPFSMGFIKKVLDRPDNHRVILRKIKALPQALMEGGKCLNH